MRAKIEFTIDELKVMRNGIMRLLNEEPHDDEKKALDELEAKLGHEIIKLMINENPHYLRFWNIANENIQVDGSYCFTCDGLKEAEDLAESLKDKAIGLGAIWMDINNDFYCINEDALEV